MASTWKAFIDLDGDGVWDAGDDISADVKTLSFSNGFQKPFRSMTDENECVIQVDNTDGKYNPENSGSSFYGRLQVQRRVKIEHVGASSSGLLANWELSDAVGSSTVKAYPDSGYGGSPSNLTLGADGIGDGKTAATFDGSSSVVNIFSSDLASNFDGSEGTLAAWAKVSGAGIWSDSASHVIAVIYADVNNFVFIYKAASNVLAATFRANGFNGTVVYSTTTADWFHVALTWDGSLITLYFNGVQAYQRNDALTWSGIPTLALIGNYWAGSQYWSGDVQHVLLANRAFSGDEIAALHARQVAYTVTLYEQPMWVGWIEKIETEWKVGGDTGQSVATLHCIGAREYLQNEEINLPLLENQTATELLEYMLTRVQIPPIVEDVWLAGKPGFSEAGVTTFAGDISSFTDFDSGEDDYVFRYFPPQRGAEPDNQVKARSALKRISQVVEAVRGYFYFSRDGKAVFRGHDWLMKNTLRSLSINTASVYEPVQVRYVSGAYLANTVAVKIFPRSNGGSLTLYTLAAPVTVSAASSKTFEAPFVDSNFIETGAENVSIDTETYSSGEATASIEVLADRALVTVDNTAGSVDAVLSVFILTGEPLRGDKSVVIRKSDTASQGSYGRRRDLTLNLRALDDYRRAEDIADFELYRRKDARSEVSHLTFFNAADGADNVFQFRGIGERIRLVAAEVGHDADYYIVGEKHVLKEGLNFHETTWTLEPQTAHVVWLAGIDGYSNAGTTTYAGY